MSAVLMEEKSSNSTILSAEFLSLFAKACYLKNRDDESLKYQDASTSLTEWSDKLGKDITGWEVIKLNDKDVTGVGEAWAGFSAVAYKNEETKEIIEKRQIKE